jgi:hypothetical protein
MAMQTLTFKLSSVSPLLMHNGRLADPMNEYSRRMKEVSGKRSKTDADFIEMARIEWYGGMYLMDGGKPCITGEVLEAAIINAARKTRKGKQAMGGIICPDNYPLTFDGPQDLDERWADDNCRLTCGVRIQKARIMRTRPIFREWSLVFSLIYDDLQLNEKDVIGIVKVAGENGLCDWRPKFGRFNAERI